ncbi:hypothetical protein HanHA300_Chr12g0439371 [Helianthus annuus]|nr:hypothetical protein HanHA300_Chr12g0439371 [Helianthus annuus]KAJ0504921.1 hypothetical protein HanHA89_Chr12g0464651 [Helianthus annuus]KAJ0674611.1 hypothetical protein HanLR1_Chr12g0441841 [Helianthus annuus]
MVSSHFPPPHTSYRWDLSFRQTTTPLHRHCKLKKACQKSLFFFNTDKKKFIV